MGPPIRSTPPPPATATDTPLDGTLMMLAPPPSSFMIPLMLLRSSLRLPRPLIRTIRPRPLLSSRPERSRLPPLDPATSGEPATRELASPCRSPEPRPSWLEPPLHLHSLLPNSEIEYNIL